MRLHRFLAVALALIPLVAQAQPPLLQTINLRSGNGMVGGTDSQISMLVGPGNAPFPNPFTPADFTAASSGPPAFIITPDPAWTNTLPADPAARWIGTVASGFGQGSGLYAVDFTVLPAAFVSATLTLDFLVDNYVGSAISPGVFFNGTPVSGNTYLPACAPTGCAGFFTPTQLVRMDIAPLLTTGTNTLYVYGNDTGVTGGIIFSATIEVFGFNSPEYQTNFSFASSLDVNGVQGTAFTPATVTIGTGVTGTLNLASVNVGELWDLGSGLAPLITASGGAFLTSDGQIINLDAADPTLSLWFDFFQGPAWGPGALQSIPFSIPTPTAVSLQMVVVDPGLMSGVALSQPTRLVIQ